MWLGIVQPMPLAVSDPSLPTRNKQELYLWKANAVPFLSTGTEDNNCQTRSLSSLESVASKTLSIPLLPPARFLESWQRTAHFLWVLAGNSNVIPLSELSFQGSSSLVAPLSSHNTCSHVGSFIAAPYYVLVRSALYCHMLNITSNPDSVPVFWNPAMDESLSKTLRCSQEKERKTNL